MLRTEYIDVDFNLKLKKDLQEHEVICYHCGGTGLQVDDNPFGIKEENSKIHFPHKQQTIVGCRHCYNGVQSKCLHCGKILDRGTSQCDCEISKQERLQERRDKDLETWNKAKKISFEEASEKYTMLYVDDSDKYIMIDEFEDWIHDEILELDEIKLLRVYGTQEMELSIDASDVIENACSDLHEDARDNISVQEEKSLQILLDQWCEENKQGTKTYYADYSVGILL